MTLTLDIAPGASRGWSGLSACALSSKKTEGVIRDEHKARQVLERLMRPGNRLIGFDTETIGWRPKDDISPYGVARCCILSLSDEQESWAFGGELLGIFRPLFEDGAGEFCGVNLKFDAAVLHNHGIDIKGKLFDARIMARMRNVTTMRRYGLKEMAKKFLNREMMEFKSLGKGERNSHPSSEDILDQDPMLFAEYARDDAELSRALVVHLRKDLEKMPWHGGKNLWQFITDFEEPYTHVLMGMERRGVLIDQDRLKVIGRDIAREVEHLQDRLEEIVKGEFNINSPDQVAALLYRKLKHTPWAFTDTKRCGICNKKATKATGHVCREHGGVDLRKVPSTKGFVIEELMARGCEVSRLLFRMRKVSKLQSSFIPQMSKVCPDGRTRTSWNQGGAETWRLSASKPPLQTIPRPDNDDPNNPDPLRRGFALRELFLPSPGKEFVVADESQVELRMLAHLSGDPRMIDIYKNDGDIHSEAAIALFDLNCAPEDVARLFPSERSDAKPFNFGVGYGAGQRRVASMYKVSKAKAKEMIEGYFQRFPGILAYKSVVERHARQHGYIRSLLGRYRHLPQIHRVAQSHSLQKAYWNDEKLRSRYQAEFREAVNFGCQGGTADIMQSAMLIIDGYEVPWHPLKQDLRLLEMGAVQLMQVHDEVVLEVDIGLGKEAGAALEDAMNDPVPGLRVPIRATATWGPSWAK